MFSAVYWSGGKSQTPNQDSLFLERMQTGRGEFTVAAVCDGIGGLPRGEIASGYVTERLLSLTYDDLLPRIHHGQFGGGIRRSVLRALYDCKEKMKEYAAANGLHFGTTLVCVCVLQNRFIAFHTGDSRAYLLRRLYRQGKNGGIKALFRDDVRDGRLCGCIGSLPAKRPDVKGGVLFSGDTLLLCSDGFYRSLPEKTLAETLRLGGGAGNEVQLYKRLQTLAEESVRRGSRDHISAVALCAGKRREKRIWEK